jgi:hypothetical protein
VADSVLYFPYIRVPEDHWFTRALLYWDQVGTIVPHEIYDKPDMLGHYTAELIRAELVRAVFPDQHLGLHQLNFTEGFLQIIAQDPLVTRRQGGRLVEDDVVSAPLGTREPGVEASETAERSLMGPAPLGTSFIHVAKFGWQLANALEDKGLARKLGGPEYAQWYLVEERTAALFMAYLAIVLGQLDDVKMIPISDQFESLSVFSAAPTGFSAKAALADQLQMQVIEDILPAPSRAVTVAKLRQFKDDHSRLLSRLRTEIELFVLDAIADTDAATRQRRLELFRRRLKDEIYEIRARMHERRWPGIVFGTVCGVAAAAAPLATAATAGAAAPALISVPGLLNGVYAAFRDLKRDGDFRNSPVAYAALAQEHLMRPSRSFRDRIVGLKRNLRAS